MAGEFSMFGSTGDMESPLTGALQPFNNQAVAGYAQLLEPQYQRSRAQIANMMGGKNTFYGTPGANKLQLLEGQRMGDIGKFGLGLAQTQEQRAYDQPFKLAELLGYMPGQGTYAPGQGWSWTGPRENTVASQAAGAAQTQANAAAMAARAEAIKGIMTAFPAIKENPMLAGTLLPLLDALMKYGWA